MSDGDITFIFFAHLLNYMQLGLFTTLKVDAGGIYIEGTSTGNIYARGT